MSEEITPLRFNVEEVGKHVKGSKKRFTWEFSSKGKLHLIVLDFSFISGKVKLAVDRRVLYESELPSNAAFQHPFTLDGYAVNVIQQGELFELRINNKVFSHLYNQQKTTAEFRGYESEIKDVQVDHSKFEKKQGSVQLNIGALGDKKKKKQNNTTSDVAWDAFGNEESFPSYFKEGDTAPTKTETVRERGSENLIDEPVETKQEDILEMPVVKQEVISPSQEALIEMTKPSDFNTMQGLFATSVQPQQANELLSQIVLEQPKEQPREAPQVNQNDQSVNMSDFNTMQAIFATQGIPLPVLKT